MGSSAQYVGLRDLDHDVPSSSCSLVPMIVLRGVVSVELLQVSWGICMSPVFTFPMLNLPASAYGSFRKLGVPYFGVLIKRILLFRVRNKGPPIFGNSHMPHKASATLR